MNNSSIEDTIFQRACSESLEEAIQHKREKLYGNQLIDEMLQKTSAPVGTSWITINPSRNGNCNPANIKTRLYLNDPDVTIKTIRDIIVQAVISSNPNWTSEQRCRYIDSMGVDGTVMGECEIKAASVVFKIVIKIWTFVVATRSSDYGSLFGCANKEQPTTAKQVFWS